jgi:hypothetical protein
MTDILLGGARVAASSVRAEMAPDGEKVGVALFLPGYSETACNTYPPIAYLFHDQALGEYDVETSWRDQCEARFPAKSLSLEELPNALNALTVPKHSKTQIK